MEQNHITNYNYPIYDNSHDNESDYNNYVIIYNNYIS